MRRFLAFQASSLDSMSNIAHRDGTWYASSRIKLQNLLFFMCFEIKLKMYHMVKWLNDQNTKKNQLYCSIPLHPSVLLQCIETGGIETRILSPISFLCLAKKNLEKLGLQNPAFWHFNGVNTISIFWLSSFNFQQRNRMWWQPAFLLWSKIWRGLELEMKGFQVCIWTRSILIRLDFHQIGDYDADQGSIKVGIFIKSTMLNADAENIEYDAEIFHTLWFWRWGVWLRFYEKDHLDEDFNEIMTMIMDILMLIKYWKILLWLDRKP